MNLAAAHTLLRNNGVDITGNTVVTITKAYFNMQNILSFSQCVYIVTCPGFRD
jgi:hypothetical protein